MILKTILRAITNKQVVVTAFEEFTSKSLTFSIRIVVISIRNMKNEPYFGTERYVRDLAAKLSLMA